MTARKNRYPGRSWYIISHRLLWHCLFLCGVLDISQIFTYYSDLWRKRLIPAQWELYFSSGASEKKWVKICLSSLNYPVLPGPRYPAPTKSNKSPNAPQGIPCIQRLSPDDDQPCLSMWMAITGTARGASFSLFFLFCIIRFFFPSPKPTHTELKNLCFSFYWKPLHLDTLGAWIFKANFSLIIKLNLSTYWVPGLY